MAQLPFDATAVDPSPSFTPVPAGIYLAHVTDSDVKQTKNGLGHYAALTLEILEGEFKGRKVFTNINIANQNAQAEQIGQKVLSQLCHAVGVLKLQDTAQLHNRPMRIKVIVTKSDQYGDKNEVKGFEAVAVAGAAQPAAQAPAQPATAPAPATPAVPPWARKNAA